MSEQTAELDLESIVFKIISQAGDARSDVMNALREARKGDYKKAKETIEKADKKLSNAHQVHKKIIQKEAKGEKVEMSVLMAHAEDHFMNAQLARDLVKEMIPLFEETKES